jgi:stage II sporulation protein D
VRRAAPPGGGLRSGRATLLLGALLLAASCARMRPSGPPAGPEEEVPPPAPAPAERPAARPDDAWRRVRTIEAGLAAAAPKLLLAGSRAWTLRRLDGETIAEGSAGARLLLRRRGPGPVELIHEGEGTPFWYGGPGDTLLLSSDGGLVGWNRNWYRGTFRVFTSQPEGITLVNAVGLEDYLRSVLPNEIGNPKEGEYEAVKAQAVAARSYTLGYLGRRAALGFDLWATVEDQVYAGTTRENGACNRALEETHGEVLLSEGAPIRALYSSACGGRTANVEDVWPWPWTPYLRSVLDAPARGETAWCAGSSSYRWREEWPVTGFMKMLRQYAGSGEGDRTTLAGDFLNVLVRSRSRCGRVADLVISTTRGDLVVHGDRTRWALRRPGGSAILRSSLFKIGVVRGADGSPARVVATGAGNGHGIGLCQWGALGMSRAGKSYREILSHYYKATTLARVRG